MRGAVIFDIDGTLADITHRLPRAGFEAESDKSVYGAGCGDDEPIHEIIMVARALYDAGLSIVLVSGRMEIYSSVTTHWLAAARVPPNTLLMRATGDYRADWVIKREMLREIRLLDLNPILVFDDRECMVRMWRAEGLRCCQVARGDY